MSKKVLITGANRGLGYASAEKFIEMGYEVILTARDPDKGRQAAARLGMPFYPLDVTDPLQITALKEEIGPVDVLVNNAGVLLDRRGVDPVEEKKIFIKTLEVNVIGVYQMCSAFMPLMEEQGYGRVVNLSSGAAQLEGAVYYKPIYSASKTALNAITVKLSCLYQNSNVLINSICPGWVKTDMGGPDAARGIEEGIEGIIWAATLPDGGPTGGFFRDGKRLPW